MHRTLALAALAAALLPGSALAHAPSVLEETASTPADAVVLADPTLSRAIGATISEPGEVDWYRMDLAVGEPLVVGMTAPDAPGSLAATFVLLGPGLPTLPADDERLSALAAAAGAEGGLVFQPAADPPLEVHGGLGFTNYGAIRLEAPSSGSYWVAVSAVDPDATGKYVLAPGVREEFGVDAIGGMIDLVDFFRAPWPPDEGED
jgi:hypothetical protein